MSKAALSRRTVIGGGAALAGSSVFSGPVHAAVATKPNVVFIMADDLGAFDLSCYGRPDYRTPRIDSLAADGMRFTHGYSSSASCTPTRVGLISGRYPNRVPVGTVEGGGATSSTVGYRAEWPSIARVMRTAGYRTGLIGKWNLGPVSHFPPLAAGYDEFYGFTGGAIDYWSHDTGLPLSSKARTADLYDGDRPATGEGYSTTLFTQRALSFIERHHARPFFLSLHFSAPHWPWQTPVDRAEGRLNDFHYDGGSMRAYAEIMATLDEAVGRVLDTLARVGIANDTLVVFTSDNGGERFSYMWPLKGAKGDLYEGGVRVPILARWPKRIPAGSTSDQVMLSMDWLPTLAALAGGSPDPAAPPDGMDISSQLSGSPATDRTVFWKTLDSLSALAFPWKYLRVGTREHLFNLDEDVSENANFKRREPGIFARLKEEAEAWERTMLSPAERRPQSWEALRALDPPDAPPTPQ